MTTIFRLAFGAVLATAIGAPASGQTNGRTYSLTPMGVGASVGITALDCVQCTIRLAPSMPWIEYGTEPVVRGVQRNDNLLRPNDAIVAVDGILITTPAGARRFAMLEVGRATRFTIRRDGRQMDVSVLPTSPTWALHYTVDGVDGGISAPVIWQSLVPDNGSKVTGWQFGTFGFSNQPTYTSTWTDGSPTNAVHVIPDPFYLTSISDSGALAKDLRFINVPVGGTIRIYSSDGNLVRVLQNTEAGAAVHWNARDRSNQVVPSGIYFYTVESAGASRSGRLTVVNSARSGRDSMHWQWGQFVGPTQTDTLSDGTIRTLWNGGRDTNFTLPRPAGRSSTQRPYAIRIDTSIGGKQQTHITFAPSAMDAANPYGTTAEERSALAASGARGRLGFGLECRDCYSEIDSTLVRQWRFPTFPAVAAVDPTGPAAAAGILAGDVLHSIDGVSIRTPAGATRFSVLKPGDRTRLTLDRNGRAIDVVLTVAPAAH